MAYVSARAFSIPLPESKVDIFIGDSYGVMEVSMKQ